MLTDTDVTLVRESFAKVVPIADSAADLFYDRLFELAPNLRSMFARDLREQKRKLMAMIAAAVAGLDDLEKLVPTVRALGERHTSYGVTVAHYAAVGEALLWTLQRGLGEAFTPAVRSAWAKVYALLATTMQIGAGEAGSLPATR